MIHPRILIVGKDGLLTWHDSLRVAFAELGFESQVFSASPRRLGERASRLCGAGRSLDNRLIRGRFRRAIARFQPDLILSLIGAFPREILEDAGCRNGRRPLLAVWMCDSLMHEFNPQQHEKLDFFFTFDRSQMAKAAPFVRSDGFFSLPLAFDPREYHPLPKAHSEAVAVFAGSCTEERLELAINLRARGIPLATAGMGWQKRGLKIRQPRLTHAQLNRHFNAGSVAINHVQHLNTAYGINLRAFEATGAGACLITPVVFDLASCFEPGLEVVSYRSTDELAELVKRGLSDPAWSRKIAAAGHRRALAEHTFVHRARTIATHCGWI